MSNLECDSRQVQFAKGLNLTDPALDGRLFHTWQPMMDSTHHGPIDGHMQTRPHHDVGANRHIVRIHILACRVKYICLRLTCPAKCQRTNRRCASAMDRQLLADKAI